MIILIKKILDTHTFCKFKIYKLPLEAADLLATLALKIEEAKSTMFKNTSPIMVKIILINNFNTLVHFMDLKLILN